MYEELCRKFHTALVNAFLPVASIKIVADEDPKPLVTYDMVPGVGFLEVTWVIKPRERELVLYQQIAGVFNFAEIISRTHSRDASEANIMRIIEKWPQSTQQSLLLKLLCHSLVDNPTFAKKCGIHL